MHTQQERTLPVREFDFDGGLLCLDFLNTQPGRAGGVERENLKDYSYLLTWALQARIIDNATAHTLLAEAQRCPVEAEQVLRQSVALRESLYRLVVADMRAQAIAQEDLAIFNTMLKESLCHSHLLERDGHFQLGWDEQAASFDCMVWDIVRSAVELLTSEDMKFVRTCADETCDWVFLDTTRNRSRRWCSMRSCGNRAKARRHHEKQKQMARPFGE